MLTQFNVSLWSNKLGYIERYTQVIEEMSKVI